MKNFLDTVVSQYGNSETLLQLIENFNDYIDPNADLDTFYDYVWNVKTAVGFGLDIWGAIVGVGRNLTVPNGTFFGFAGTGYQPFGQAPFYSVAGSTVTYPLSDEAYRVLILVKALANISNSTTFAYNRLLNILFAGRGRCYVLDLGNMQMQYTFEFALQPFEIAILNTSGAVPKPAGVAISVVQL